MRPAHVTYTYAPAVPGNVVPYHYPGPGQPTTAQYLEAEPYPGQPATQRVLGVTSRPVSQPLYPGQTYPGQPRTVAGVTSRSVPVVSGSLQHDPGSVQLVAPPVNGIPQHLRDAYFSLLDDDASSDDTDDTDETDDEAPKSTSRTCCGEPPRHVTRKIRKKKKAKKTKKPTIDKEKVTEYSKEAGDAYTAAVMEGILDTDEMDSARMAEIHETALKAALLVLAKKGTEEVLNKGTEKAVAWAVNKTLTKSLALALEARVCVEGGVMASRLVGRRGAGVLVNASALNLAKAAAGAAMHKGTNAAAKVALTNAGEETATAFLKYLGEKNIALAGGQKIAVGAGTRSAQVIEAINPALWAAFVGELAGQYIVPHILAGIGIQVNPKATGFLGSVGAGAGAGAFAGPWGAAGGAALGAGSWVLGQTIGESIESILGVDAEDKQWGDLNTFGAKTEIDELFREKWTFAGYQSKTFTVTLLEGQCVSAMHIVSRWGDKLNGKLSIEPKDATFVGPETIDFTIDGLLLRGVSWGIRIDVLTYREE